MNVPEIVEEMSHELNLYVVGGAVRDHLMGIEPVDFDLVVEGQEEDHVVSVLSQWGDVEKVIGNAPVYVVKTIEGPFEVALCRKETSTGRGKGAFEFVADPEVSIYEDLERRDFRANAIAYHVASSTFIDPFGGADDIERGFLKPVGPSFVESPERVLRGASFCARFGWEPSMSFIGYAGEMLDDYYDIPVEQVWRHVEKMYRKSSYPSEFFRVLYITGWLEYFPEMQRLIGCPQDEEYHPEGDVFEHTLYALDETPPDVALRLAVTCHDMGKPDTTEIHEDGRITSYGHDQHTEPAISFMDRIGCPPKIQEEVIALVKNHMCHVSLQEVTSRFVRRLSVRIQPSSIDRLAELVYADYAGRPPLPKEVPLIMERILEVAQEIEVDVEREDPLLMGRHLIEMGLTPGPIFGEILDAAYEAQLEEEFLDVEGAIRWFEEWRNG